MTSKNFRVLLLLRGILFIIFGFLAIGWPGMALATLAFAFALLILLSGIANLINGILTVGRAYRYWFLSIIIGIIEIGVGAYAFNNPGIGLATLILLIGFTLIIRGIFDIAYAFDTVYSSSYRALFAIGGIIGIIAGIVILRYPVAGTLSFIWVLGLYTLVTGSIYAAMSIMGKEISEDPTRLA